MFRDGKRITVDDGNCTAERPPVRQTCNRYRIPRLQYPTVIVFQFLVSRMACRSVVCLLGEVWRRPSVSIGHLQIREGRRRGTVVIDRLRSTVGYGNRSIIQGKLLAADQCEAGADQETQRTCNLGPCDGLKFTTTDWKLVWKCVDASNASIVFTDAVEESFIKKCSFSVYQVQRD